MKRIALSLVVLLVAGCNIPPDVAIQLGAKHTTVAALELADADIDDAANLRTVAQYVGDVVSGEDPDYGEIERRVYAMILELFDGQSSAVMSALVADVGTLIRAQLERVAFPTGSTVAIYVEAAARGVADGAQLFIDVRTEPVSALVLEEHPDG